MKKTKTAYVCTECGATALQWSAPARPAARGHADGDVAERGGVKRAAGAAPGAVSLQDVEARELERMSTGIDELDRVLGGGLVAGQVVLLGGDPGIGKSTLLLQALAGMRSFEQGGLHLRRGVGRAGRAARAAPGARRGRLELLAEIQLERILATLEAQRPEVAVVDSIQTLWSEALQSAPGSVAQVRECAAQLARYAKTSGTALFIVGHVTKEGAIAGPRVLEHIVDTVLYFEGDTHSSFRLVRAFKNRFGAVNELGVFAMTDKGLRGVTNPSALFLSHHEKNVAGSCVLATQEGTRPLLVEIQALVDSAHAPNPRRLSVGLEQNRLAMLLAVLHRHAGIATYDQDVFVNAVGGVRIAEPAADLAVLLAIVSSLTDRPIRRKGRVRRDRARRRGAPRAARPGAPEGGGEARLREGDRAEGQPAEIENRRDRGDRGRARGPGGPGAAQSLSF